MDNNRNLFMALALCGLVLVGWETFVARDLVETIDARYRTIRSPAGRAIGGLSEGGYGAINIGLHHPREFKVIESWSGYAEAADISSIFGSTPFPQPRLR